MAKGQIVGVPERVSRIAILLMGFVLGHALQVAAQPVPGEDGGGAWWGATAWIIITLVFIVLAAILVVKGAKQPNRR